MNKLGRTLLIALMAGTAVQAYAQDQAKPASALPLPSVSQEKPTLAPQAPIAAVPVVTTASMPTAPAATAPAAPAASAPVAPIALAPAAPAPAELPQPVAPAGAVTSSSLQLPTNNTPEALPLPGEKRIIPPAPSASSLSQAQAIPVPEHFEDPSAAELATQTPDQKAKADSKVADIKSAKHHKKHKTKEASAAPYHYVAIKDRLPNEIYAKEYNTKNRHLPVAHYEKDYDNLLFSAAKNNDMNGIRSIMKTGRKVDMTDAAGNTPLHAAVKNDSLNSARLLLVRNADPDAKNNSGVTPTDLANKSGDPKMVKALKDGPAQY